MWEEEEKEGVEQGPMENYEREESGKVGRSGRGEWRR